MIHITIYSFHSLLTFHLFDISFIIIIIIIIIIIKWTFI